MLNGQHYAGRYGAIGRGSIQYEQDIVLLKGFNLKPLELRPTQRICKLNHPQFVKNHIFPSTTAYCGAPSYHLPVFFCGNFLTCLWQHSPGVG